jgi:hypothetical protein
MGEARDGSKRRRDIAEKAGKVHALSAPIVTLLASSL